MRTIQEYLIDILRSTRLYEMTESQRECENTVRSQIWNILENLTLINYFKVSQLYTTNIEHWKDELVAAIFNASRFKPKKDSSEGRRRRIVKRIFDEKDVWDYNRVYDSVQAKFYKESETQYPDNSNSDEWLDEAVLNTIGMMEDILELIVKQNTRSIKDWIQIL